MKLVTTVRLDPPDPQELLARIETFNSACNALSEHAFQSRTFGWLALQRAAYHWLLWGCRYDRGAERSRQGAWRCADGRSLGLATNPLSQGIIAYLKEETRFLMETGFRKRWV